MSSFQEQALSQNITISNKQRRLKVERAWLETTCAQLFAAVLANLKKRPALHLDGVDWDELARRGTLSLVLVSDQTMRKLNRQWMGKDRPTDVLSFPLELETPPQELPWEVGEIVISVETARAQAEQLGHSFQRELAFLFVHGMLHIFGFDHMNPEEEKEMFGRQRQILDKAGFPRV